MPVGIGLLGQKKRREGRTRPSRGKVVPETRSQKVDAFGKKAHGGNHEVKKKKTKERLTTKEKQGWPEFRARETKRQRATGSLLK